MIFTKNVEWQWAIDWLATIYLGDLEEANIKTTTKQPLLWVKCIDDILTIWTYSMEEFYNFLEGLNNMHPKINFTANTCISTLAYENLHHTKISRYMVRIQCHVYKRYKTIFIKQNTQCHYETVINLTQ